MRLIYTSSLSPKFRHIKMLSIFLFFLLDNHIAFGQDVTKNNFVDRNSFTVEVFGHCRSIFSANYERLFNISPNYYFYTVRTGIGYSPGVNIGSERIKSTVTVPFVFSILAGRKQNFAQLSASYAASFGHDFIDSTIAPPAIYQKFESAYSLSLGYRYMWNDFVAQAFPLIQWTNNPSAKFSVGFGVSLGMTF